MLIPENKKRITRRNGIKQHEFMEQVERFAEQFELTYTIIDNLFHALIKEESFQRKYHNEFTYDKFYEEIYDDYYQFQIESPVDEMYWKIKQLFGTFMRRKTQLYNDLLYWEEKYKKEVKEKND